MGILTSLFGKKPEPPPPDPNAIKESVQAVSDFCRDVMRHSGEAVFTQDSMERQVLSVYAFGGIHVLCQQRGFNVPQGHAIALVVFKDFLGYSVEDSAAKAHAVITAARDRTSHLNGIIHRGIDGFLAWQEHRATFDAADFRDVINRLQKKRSAYKSLDRMTRSAVSRRFHCQHPRRAPRHRSGVSQH